MKYEMRQSRDGVTEIVDVSQRALGGGALSLLGPAKWSGALTWFMRTVAWVWVFKGLFNWAVVIGISPRFGDFVMLPHHVQGMIVFFAAADLLAAVGVWLAAPWGGALWQLCAVIEAISPLFGARGAFGDALGVGLNIVLVAVYFTLSWRASLESE